MFHGRNTGKKALAVRIVKHTLEIVNLMTGKNPIEVLVEAIMNSGAREDSTRIGTAGVVKKQAVDVSPLRRVNQALYFIATGAREASFRTMKTIAECLADELMNAAKASPNSWAVKKKDEIEKVAKGNRWEEWKCIGLVFTYLDKCLNSIYVQFSWRKMLNEWTLNIFTLSILQANQLIKNNHIIILIIHLLYSLTITII